MCNRADNGGKWIRQDKRLAVYLRDGLACAYCGRPLELGGTELTLDHVVSQGLGGGNDEGNLVTACKACNSAKQAKSLRAFFGWLRDVRGIETAPIARRIRRQTARKLDGYRAEAKALMARR